MIPWVELDRATVPGGGVLRLLQRGAEYSIMAGTNELMNSRKSGSEEALAQLALARLSGRQHPRVLIGGLGMGFTLRAALAASSDAELVVAELVPAIIGWAKGPLAPVFGTCLGEPRVSVVEADVGRLIAADKAGYDAILLDVDNGPDGLVRAGNDSLYGAAGLRTAYAALRPGGVLAIWSAGIDPGFGARLQRGGFAVEPVKARAHGGRGARHTIWLATRA